MAQGRRGEGGQELTKLFTHINQGQRDVWESQAVITAAISGHGGGKSQVGAYWLLREIWRNAQNGGGSYLVAGPTYNTLQKSSIPKLRGLLRLHGLPWDYDQAAKVGFRVQQKEYWMPDGSIIYFVSCDKPGSMQGAHANAFWLDETVDTDFYAFETLLGRVALRRGRGIITSTPYDLGWLYSNIYQPWVAAGRPGPKKAREIFVAQWKSIDNPRFAKERYEWFQRNWPAWRFRMLYEGEFERPIGLVYDCFQENTWVEPFEIPREWPRILGIDFGYHDPTACVWLAQAPDGICYLYDEYYQTGWMRFADDPDGGSHGKHSAQMDMIDEIIARCVSRNEVPEGVYCDDSEPDYIEQTRQHFEDQLGIDVVFPAHKKTVMPGVQRCYSLVKSDKIRVFNNLPRFRDEVQSYSYQTNKTTGELEKGAAPKDNNNHLMDAWRYGIVGHAQRETSGLSFGRLLDLNSQW